MKKIPKLLLLVFILKKDLSVQYDSFQQPFHTAPASPSLTFTSNRTASSEQSTDRLMKYALMTYYRSYYFRAFTDKIKPHTVLLIGAI